MVVDTLFFALLNAAEALIAAGLIERYFGPRFSLNSLREVLGLLIAAIIATAVSGVGGTLGFKFFYSSSAPAVTTWQHWLVSDALGILTVAPLLIGLASAVREPPWRKNLIEGLVGLVAVAVMSGFAVFLPRDPLATIVPVALFFPVLLWLAARCQPVLAAAAAFIVSLTIVWTTTFGIGIFGDASLPISDRILGAQASILAVSLCAFVLAALFAERRANEARLTRSNMLLERERDSKLMNVEAVTASIAHEVRQPLSAIATNSSAALRFLGQTPPNLEEARSALHRIVGDSHRTSEIFNNIRALFASTDSGQEMVDVNQMTIETLSSLKGELINRGIVARINSASNLPLVSGHKGQLQQVVTNLLQNAIEAMENTEITRRLLQVKTKRYDNDTIIVEVKDSGPGVDPKVLEHIFDAFVTTKASGMGLGLAICRLIVERHGGKLYASSDEETGALFQFTLPIEHGNVGSAVAE
jgi:signal transduction histidine kinase